MLQHLEPERLAALGDGEPTTDEAAHLAVCDACARERAAYRELVALAASERRTVLVEPLTTWGALAGQLTEEGLLRQGAAPAPRGHRRPWLQAAAAVLLTLGGAAVGRATATRPAGIGAEAPGRGANALAGERLADSAGGVVSVEDALALMQRAESDYRLAAAYLAAHDTAASERGGVDRFRTRLAALDRVSDAALAAVNEAPADPIINQYLISARTARAVTLQQLNSSLPEGVTLTSY